MRSGRLLERYSRPAASHPPRGCFSGGSSDGRRDNQDQRPGVPHSAAAD